MKGFVDNLVDAPEEVEEYDYIKEELMPLLRQINDKLTNGKVINILNGKDKINEAIETRDALLCLKTIVWEIKHKNMEHMLPWTHHIIQHWSSVFGEPTYNDTLSS